MDPGLAVSRWWPGHDVEGVSLLQEAERYVWTGVLQPRIVPARDWLSSFTNIQQRCRLRLMCSGKSGMIIPGTGDYKVGHGNKGILVLPVLSI